MSYLELSVEVQRDSSGFLEIVGLTTRGSSQPIRFCATDISEAFNPGDEPLNNFAFAIRFTLPLSFDHAQAVDAFALEYGVDPRDLINLCSRATAMLVDADCHFFVGSEDGNI